MLSRYRHHSGDTTNVILNFGQWTMKSLGTTGLGSVQSVCPDISPHESFTVSSQQNVEKMYLLASPWLHYLVLLRFVDVFQF
jgi:hypothetical protein